MQCSFKGLGTALVTPFQHDGSIDWDALARIVDAQLRAGVDFLVPCGTTGEAPTLTTHEQLQVVVFILDQVRGSVPVIPGTGSNSTEHAVEMTRRVMNLGADGALVVVPYYNKPNQRGMIEHFLQVADVGLPVIVYNIPGRTGVNLLPETLYQISAHANIVALKDATGDMVQAKENFRLCGDALTYLCGDDARTLEFIEGGGHGVISVISNLDPMEMKKLVSMAQEGDWQGAAEVHVKLLPLIEAIFTEVNPSGIKWAMGEVGVMGPTLRLPLVTPIHDNREAILRAMHEFGL
jgi:4-hydroxy-tetrahydrodipicolinate synthase